MMGLSTRKSSLVLLSPNPNARLNLICVPYAGGGVVLFRDWAQSLPPEVRVCAVQLPGRDTLIGRPPFTSVFPLVDFLVDVLDPYLDLPFALFGHSMGGLIIFELARALRSRKNLAPVHFFVSACRAPQRPGRSSALHVLPREAFVRELRSRYDGIPSSILQDEDLMNLFIPILRADLELVETYRDPGGEPFGFPITAFGGLADGEINREDVEGWRDQTKTRFRLQMFPGNHFFFHTARPALLRAIHEDLFAYLATR